MKRILKIHVLLALIIIVAATAFTRAQSGRVPGKGTGPQARSDDNPVRLHAEEVLLQVNFQSKLGKLPAQLDQSDFIVTEDDKRQHITSIMRTPANILIILDASGDETTLKNINTHRELALKLIEALGEEDKVAVIAYADKVKLLSSWTNDRAALKQALDWKFRPAPNPHLYDSLMYAADDLLLKVTGRRSVVLMTDGIDKPLQIPFETVLDAMHHARATVYVVSQAAMLVHELKPKILKPPPIWLRIDIVVRQRYKIVKEYVGELEAAAESIHALAEETGGKIWDLEQRIHCADDSTPFDEPPAERRQRTETIDCETIKKEIIEEIGSEYIVAYSSERPSDDTKLHLTRVYSKRTDLQVRVRRGIYATKPPGETAHPNNQ